MPSITENIKSLENKLDNIQSWIAESSEIIKRNMGNNMRLSWIVPEQSRSLNAMHIAICVDTVDPWKQGAVKCFSPLLQDPTQLQIVNLPWAMPISPQGGFDDSGCTWVPPAGSKLCLVFEDGNRERPFYLGTTWDRSRKEGWKINVEEYEKIHRGHRGGYMVGTRGTYEAGVYLEGGPGGGTRDEEQVFPPWNTENYNGYDIDSLQDFENDPEAKNKITYPNIYGWKTPQKHMIKMVDGNYKCNMRWQRLEIKSAQGNHLIFKDDKTHPAPQWANPECSCGSGDVSTCNDGDIPVEKVDTCPTSNVAGSTKPTPVQIMMIGAGGGSTSTVEKPQGQCANPYFKHKSECRPYSGPGNPQNNKVDNISLPQSGIQLLSLSGHTFWMDDSVNEPKGSNAWENGIKPFDYGCDDVFKGKTVWKSAHGHQIMMSDVEADDQPKTRSAENFIRILTATGNRIELNDETNGATGTAGPRRGIELQSTSNHLIQMIDENNDQKGPERAEGGTPASKATNAFVKIRTGYGLEIMMADDNDQEDTQTQYIQLTAPQKDACAGPHVIRMQESDYCGYIFVRAGGDYMCITEGDHVTVVGVGETTPEDDFCKGGCLGPRNWFTAVSQHSVHWSCKFYFNIADIHAFMANKIILLMAGKDCPPGPDADGVQRNFDCIPCIGPVAVLLGDPETKTARLVASDRVFASASLESQSIPIFTLSPFAKGEGVNCPPPFKG